MDKSNSPVGRRTTLKLAGGAVASAVGMGGTVSARSPNDKISLKVYKTSYAEYIARQEDVEPVGVNIGTGTTISFRDETSYWRAEAFAYESQMASGDRYEETDPI